VPDRKTTTTGKYPEIEDELRTQGRECNKQLARGRENEEKAKQRVEQLNEENRRKASQ
jgi:hypothetical protein